MRQYYYTPSFISELVTTRQQTIVHVFKTHRLNAAGSTPPAIVIAHIEKIVTRYLELLKENAKENVVIHEDSISE